MDDPLKQQLLLGREHYDKGEYPQAEFLLRQVSEQADHYADVHDMLGVMAHSRADFVAAQRHFERAVLINPNYTEAQLNLMVTYNELGKYEAAREVYSRIRARTGHSRADSFVKGRIANMHGELGQAYVDAGMPVEAIRELEKAVLLCPGFPDMRTRLGVLLRDTGNTTRAREELEAARDANPKYIPARLTLGVLLLGAGEIESAIAEFEAVVELDPGNKSALTYLRIARTSPGDSRSPIPQEP